MDLGLGLSRVYVLDSFWVELRVKRAKADTYREHTET